MKGVLIAMIAGFAGYINMIFLDYINSLDIHVLTWCVLFLIGLLGPTLIYMILSDK
tara:strand:+ start:498 stop:665 length:168 start_codon:yes stop_codon:yes gene_type:complete